MAKATSKPAAKPSAKKAPSKKSATIDIEKASRVALDKLRTLNIEHQLQSDIDWCIGSYLSDRNPVGLYDMLNRSIAVFKEELNKKTKGVTAKFISDLEKTAADRN